MSRKFKILIKFSIYNFIAGWIQAFGRKPSIRSNLIYLKSFLFTEDSLKVENNWVFAVLKFYTCDGWKDDVWGNITDKWNEWLVSLNLFILLLSM